MRVRGLLTAPVAAVLLAALPAFTATFRQRGAFARPGERLQLVHCLFYQQHALDFCSSLATPRSFFCAFCCSLAGPTQERDEVDGSIWFYCFILS